MKKVNNFTFLAAISILFDKIKYDWIIHFIQSNCTIGFSISNNIRQKSKTIIKYFYSFLLLTRAWRTVITFLFSYTHNNTIYNLHRYNWIFGYLVIMWIYLIKIIFFFCLKSLLLISPKVIFFLSSNSTN